MKKEEIIGEEEKGGMGRRKRPLKKYKDIMQRKRIKETNR